MIDAIAITVFTHQRTTLVLVFSFFSSGRFKYRSCGRKIGGLVG